MTTAAIYYSACGRGHEVRSRALAVGLRAKGLSALAIPIAPGAKIAAYADVSVLDLHPSVLPEIQPSRRLVRIVDALRYDDLDAGLVVCGSASADMTGLFSCTARCLVGPEYALLRPEFAAERAFNHLRRGVRDLRYVRNMGPRELAIEMAGAQVAITYGGMRAMEATCVGTPCVIYPRNEGEHLNARGLVDAGCAIIGDESELEGIAHEFAASYSTLIEASARALSFVDGLGVGRVAQAIAELVK